MVCCLGWWHSDCRKDRKYLSLEAKKERQVFLSEKVCHTRVVSSSSWGKRFTVRQLNWCLSFTQVDSVDLIRISLYLISPNNSKVWVELCLLEQIVFSRGRKVREREILDCLSRLNGTWGVSSCCIGEWNSCVYYFKSTYRQYSFFFDKLVSKWQTDQLCEKSRRIYCRINNQQRGGCGKTLKSFELLIVALSVSTGWLLMIVVELTSIYIFTGRRIFWGFWEYRWGKLSFSVRWENGVSQPGWRKKIWHNFFFSLRIDVSDGVKHAC